ncbi:formate--tetrahydrofolate ligase [Companilactobacillus sp.]|jgi:formate--tetrahydrofolate ligase|uniref:formate--tetrahydrofolate ligase n=1 Tax=Companilactobacillus sp. TaxID=2767905 RepID=UPI0025C5613E|nr:formate--tetrahydrofolate ligase [Companilactobacillus sp.]MCH4008257.1 formate--tetrahydrofolate ligase [Companilactobacillus sp.]MCH4051564.1 formate--tetrahydrofolate ligase [Companilactobacillus sp.]MCH4076200.1 formate--tetrahydrofolate ligase [Companilactobacillus sp.]MCH4124775.1 formate--tetrahydrofolate ligase [Companilactobacillus sp.]MCH4131317.1 formate--tetrahydrofolate ligase [Companilactobacillus sp.]
MAFPSDIEIAQINEHDNMKDINEIAEKVGLDSADIEPYGHYKAKIGRSGINKAMKNDDGKLILVTSINPTPAGEGKSTVAIGLADALQRLGKKTMLALREPSLGPVMGIKGGATGGGYAQVVPMEDINLHFTGDMHALTSAINTLAALIDNHLHQGNELGIDPRRIIWKRALDINDRALRGTVIGLGSPINSIPREEHFEITVASELMAILCLAQDIDDLKERIASILIAYTYDRKPIFVRDLHVEGAITMLLKDALKPNLVQTLENTPAIIHGGPFANIAHGCNSILATKLAMKLSDYTVTEGGFGADLGGEKFMDIVTPKLNHAPNAIVIVATIRALKYNGGQKLADLKGEDLKALTLGFKNLKRHIQNMRYYNVPVVVSINRFETDTDEEIKLLTSLCDEVGVDVQLTEIHHKGSAGGVDLAKAVIKATEQEANYTRLYEDEQTTEEKIATIASEIYGANNVEYSDKARKQLKTLKDNVWDDLPVCIAKTQYSLSDDPKQLGSPKDFTLHVKELIPKLGAGFIVVLTGNVMTMPGLPSKPAALNMDVDNTGRISGLF